jgi:hypothetical protein
LRGILPLLRHHLAHSLKVACDTFTDLSVVPLESIMSSSIDYFTMPFVLFNLSIV